MTAPNRKVCIAGEDAEHRARVRHSLLANLEHSYEFVEAACASEVLEACSGVASGLPACVVLDDRLSDMSANQLIAQLSVDLGLTRCPVIVIGDERPDLHLLRAGAQDVLAGKRLTSDELVRAVDHAIERHTLLVSRNRPEVTDSSNSALFSTLIEQLPMGVYVVDAQFRLQEVNTAARPAFANVRPLIGRDFDEIMEILWGAEVGQMCADIFRHTLATGQRYISPPFYEQRFDLGVEQAFDWEIQRIVLPDGSFGVVCYFHEITDRSLAAAALRASEERFRGLFENAPIGIAHIALDGRWLRVNDALCAITGYSRDELTGINFPDITHPEDLEANLTLVRRALDGELSSFTAEQRYLRRDGSTVWVNLSASLLRDAMGAPLNFIAAIEDVTARRATMEELGQQRHFVERLTAVMPGILYVYDLPAQRIVWLNEQVAAMLGYTTEEVFGMGPGFVTRVIHPEDLPRTVAHLEAVTHSASGEVRSIEFRCRHRDGGWRWFLNYDTAFAVHADGSPHQVVGTAIDVTERKRLEEQLQIYASRLEGRVVERTAALEARAAELARSNAELEQYAYVASHDLQEPLRMVTNFVQLLQHRYKGRLDHDADEFIGYAVEGSARMLSLIQGLLAYALERARPLEPQLVELAAVADLALQQLDARVIETSARIEIGNLPAIRMDHDQALQLFQNLLGNALMFRRPRESPRIVVSAERARSEPEDDGASGSRVGWVVSVEDNGIGIEPEYRERVFQIFQRLHRREEYPGAGMGLAISRKIIERHGGTIWVEGAPGGGSIFRFTIPAEQRPEESVQQANGGEDGKQTPADPPEERPVTPR